MVIEKQHMTLDNLLEFGEDAYEHFYDPSFLVIKLIIL